MQPNVNWNRGTVSSYDIIHGFSPENARTPQARIRGKDNPLEKGEKWSIEKKAIWKKQKMTAALKKNGLIIYVVTEFTGVINELAKHCEVVQSLCTKTYMSIKSSKRIILFANSKKKHETNNLEKKQRFIKNVC